MAFYTKKALMDYSFCYIYANPSLKKTKKRTGTKLWFHKKIIEIFANFRIFLSKQKKRFKNFFFIFEFMAKNEKHI